MQKPQTVEKFIRDTFDLYLLDYKEFFHFTDDETREVCELPLVVGGELAMPLVTRAAKILGVSPDALIKMDTTEVEKWYNKFDYFDLREAFNRAEDFSYLHERDGRQRLVVAIWGEKAGQLKPTRYDEMDVLRRLDKQLQEYDKLLPGTYHPGANITGHMYAVNFCHYKEIKRLVDAYLAVVARTEELFFKAWKEDLCGDEISEYNFLTAVLGIQDPIYHKKNIVKDTIEGIAAQHDFLYYDLLKKFVPIYKVEGTKEFLSIVHIKEQHVFEPWKCAEFCQDKSMVQRYVDVFPMAKHEMRHFSMAVSKFLCYYTWSDELQEQDGPQYHKAYVPKTNVELNGDEEAAEAIRAFSGPVSLGGISSSYRLKDQDEDYHMRFTKRILAAHSVGGATNG